jgi:hypothetical protein
MRKAVLGLVGATALAVASAANATITLNTCSMSCTGPSSLDGGITTTIGYSEAGLSSPTFTEWLNFTNTLSGVYSVTLDTSSASVNFTSAYLWDGTNSYALSLLYSFGSLEAWGLADTTLAAGNYTLYINGNNSRTGSLGGTVTIQAVPEPATWAMMILGFGAVGFVLRRKRKPQLIGQLA